MFNGSRRWFNFISSNYNVYDEPTDISNWFNLLGTYDGTTRTRVLYINGKEIGSYTMGPDADITHGEFIINFDKLSDDTYLAAARVYDRVLTSGEIQLLSEEIVPYGQITADDLTFSLYQKNETYGITYQSIYPVTFEIISGSLPSTISFDTSTGEFTGKGPTDADHTYELKVRLSATNMIPAEVTVTIYTYMTARIDLWDQTFNFVSNKSEWGYIEEIADESVTYTIIDGSLPSGMGWDNSGIFQYHGSRNESYTGSVVVKGTSWHNQEGVTATMSLNVAMNQIICNDQTMNFMTAFGPQTKAVAYSGSLNTVSDAVFTLSGTLPSGVTFDSTNGTFTSDATQTQNETAVVNVTVSSSNGTSTTATGAITLNIKAGAQPMPTSGLTMWHSLSTSLTQPELGDAFTLTDNSITLATDEGIHCASFVGENGGLLNLTGNYYNTSDTVVTMSVWAKYTGDTSSYGLDACPFAIGDNWSMYNQIELTLFNYGNPMTFIKVATGTGESALTGILSGWHNYVVTLSGNNSNPVLYIDGEYIGEQNVYGGQIHAGQGVGIGGGISDYGAHFPKDKPWIGYIAGCRLYDRALTEAEILTLATEYVPTSV